MSPSIRVQTEDFDLSEEVNKLREHDAQIGAIVSFVGTVRDLNDGHDVSDLTLEHYPGMTEKMLSDIRDQAHERWPIRNSVIIHRIGTLAPQDQIVLVAVASKHRQAAFDAANFIMDFLKTQAPFWKKESLPDGQSDWVDARDSDQAAQSRWRD